MHWRHASHTHAHTLIKEQGRIAGKPDCRHELTGKRIGADAV
ncbi:MAG: hypothetical protein OXC57_01645 [Rhodobacteraceae bacterium]|nr:hypothetical protein [Paracoccaceae bacterium]